MLAPFVEWVLPHVGKGSLVDLAGVGLFNLTAKAAGAGPITAVEGDLFAARDLKRNAKGEITVVEMPVERFRAAKDVGRDRRSAAWNVESAGTRGRVNAPTFVYVSCDVATLARDSRVLLDAGYRITSAGAFDMFPNTAHVETVIALSR